jgi:hypothetical protein
MVSFPEAKMAYIHLPSTASETLIAQCTHSSSHLHRRVRARQKLNTLGFTDKQTQPQTALADRFASLSTYWCFARQGRFLLQATDFTRQWEAFRYYCLLGGVSPRR